MAALNRLLRTRGLLSSSSVTYTACRSFSSPAVAATSRSEDKFSFGGSIGDNKIPRKVPSERNVQWVFLGCLGVGKGTYASRLSNLLGVPHIATGDLVRDELSSKDPLLQKLAEIVNQGKLVSDEIIINVLSKRLEAGGTKGESGFILDGFPRTIRQAVRTFLEFGHSKIEEILEGVTDIDLVVNLKLREDILVEKCLGRRICNQCGKNFNISNINVKAENGNPGLYMAPLPPQLVVNPSSLHELMILKRL